jgi:uncharacterized protein YkwD
MRQGFPLLCALVLLAVPFPAQAAGKTTPESALLRAMNQARVQHGVAPLRLDQNLQRAAVAHSREMIASDTFEHGAFGSRLQQFNVSYSLAGENLAWGTGQLAKADAIVAEWLASPEHRANLLRPTFSRVGIADIVGAFQGHVAAHVVTTDFAN